MFGVRIMQNIDTYCDEIKDFVMLQKVVYEVIRPLNCYDRMNPRLQISDNGKFRKVRAS